MDTVFTAYYSRNTQKKTPKLVIRWAEVADATDASLYLPEIASLNECTHCPLMYLV